VVADRLDDVWQVSAADGGPTHQAVGKRVGPVVSGSLTDDLRLDGDSLNFEELRSCF
jgi:hypothetical protein